MVLYGFFFTKIAVETSVNFFKKIVNSGSNPALFVTKIAALGFKPESLSREIE
jgi:hypothetical protein